jgi:hypothetical protein
LYVLAVSRLNPSPRRDWRVEWPASGQFALIVIGLALLALVLRLYNISHIPPTISGDEGTQGAEALRVIRGELRNPFATSWLSVPTLSFFFNALTIKLLGNTVAALRLPWAIVGASTVLFVFYLVRRLKGLPIAVMTATLLAAYHYHIHFSRIGSNQIADGWFMAALLFFLYRAYDAGRPSDWAWAGVVAGLAQYAYAGARFATLMLFVAIAWFIAREGRRFWRAQRSGIVIALGALLVTAGPMLQHAIRFPVDYNGRLNSVGVLQSDWFAEAARTQPGGALPILLDQFKHAALAYNAYPDQTAWYGSPDPFFDFPTGVLFLLGLGYATLRPFKRQHFLMLVWWWGGIILGGMLTDHPPASQRLTTTAAPALYFVVLALEQIGLTLRAMWPSNALKHARPIFGAATILILSALSVHFYFVDYTPLLTYGNYNGVAASSIAYYAHDRLGPDWRIYFFGQPRLSIGFGSIIYLNPDIEGRDILDRLIAPPPIDFAAGDKNAAFIFLPERRNELDLVRRTYPNGVGEEIPSPIAGDPYPLFIVYRVKLVR